MRARIRATGEILEILDIGVSGKYFYLSNDKKYSRNELEFLSETIDWQHYRIQAAIAALNGITSSGSFEQHTLEDVIAECMILADTLIEELKKK